MEPQTKSPDASDHAVVTGLDTRKVIAQMRQYVHRNDNGSECRANGHNLTTWANTIEQELGRIREGEIHLVAALRTIAMDVHCEVGRIQRGGRVDIKTIAAWQSLADRVLAGHGSSR